MAIHMYRTSIEYRHRGNYKLAVQLVVAYSWVMSCARDATKGVCGRPHKVFFVFCNIAAPHWGMVCIMK
jgi:hypothetical protein